MNHSVNRRDFLKRSLATAAFSAFPAGSGNTIRDGSGKKVLVLGAGLAGLAAACELMQAGHDVRVLEARSRCGGRVWTLRDDFPEGMYAEAGATNVFDNHAWTLKYASQLGVTLDPMPSSKGSAIYHVRGKRIVISPGSPIDWPFELKSDEKGLGRSELWARYVVPTLKNLGDPEAADWPPGSLKWLDGISFTDFLRQQGASPGAVQILRLGLADQLGEGADEISALDLLREASPRAAVRHVYSIRGGSDALPKAFAARLGQRIQYGAPVVKIEQNGKEVRVICRRAGSYQTFTADFMICAIPFSVLRRVEITPVFSPEKQRVIARMGNTSVVRVFLQTDSRFWLDEGLTGSATTDLPIMTAYDKTHYLPGTRGMLEAYVAGEKARKLAAMSSIERLNFTRSQISRIFPALNEHYEGGGSVCWDEEEWSRGAYAWFKPGEMGAFFPVMAKPEGRIHFAGDHISASPGWMNGALQSGQRAALEIDQAISRS